MRMECGFTLVSGEDNCNNGLDAILVLSPYRQALVPNLWQ